MATSVLLRILRILSRRKQEEGKPHNQDFKAASTLSISFGQIASGSELDLVLCVEEQP